MSRAINVSLPEADVAAMCTKYAVAVSAMEPLPSGGTHLVCTTSEGAQEMRVRLKSHVVDGVVRRFAFYRARGPW
ncbi:hypothetical protein [Novosphingobium sp. BL-52-GroH]|uniref:hypothetical protein n=1 Tax=Novosphingobium sp. BL-52-GroH TaxID=3349877 RepID=UPI00384C6913